MNKQENKKARGQEYKPVTEDRKPGGQEGKLFKISPHPNP